MNIDPGDLNGVIEAGSEPQANPNPPGPPRKRRRKFDKTQPLDSPLDEAISEHLAAPRSIRQFKSFSKLAEHFGISRMTAYRRSKDPTVLQRVDWLLTQHKLAGDLFARLHWERIVAGQVRAAVAGNTKAAQFCKERAWPDQPFDFFRE